MRSSRAPPTMMPETAAALSAMGARYCRIPMDRTGVNPLRDLATLWSPRRADAPKRPTSSLAYTQKPIIYGGLATRLAGGRARFYAMVSGLGHVYSNIAGVRHALLRRRGFAALPRRPRTRIGSHRVQPATTTPEMRRHHDPAAGS